MRILLTNDDGFSSPGLYALAESLAPLGEVHIVAPVNEQSGVSHSITYLTPLTCKSISRDGKHWAWAVNGTPADCTKLAITELFKDSPFDLVVSGINNGLNAGINVLYSGTVAAAMEAAFFGITSIAISAEAGPEPDFAFAANVAAKVIQDLVAREESKSQVFNLNIPAAANEQSGELKIVPLGLAQYGRSYDKRSNPDGSPYYWALWSEPLHPPAENSDVTELRNGNVTLTPLQFDMANHGLLRKMQDWKPGF